MVSLTRFVTILVANLAIVNAQQCTQKAQRKAWHTFSEKEKDEYIQAELCLMETPPKVGINGCRTLFDELQANHQIQSFMVHWTGSFLPYHRLLMHTHEHFLKTECGYKGAQPYWDEPRDAGKFTSSILFNPVTGFGGDGRSIDRCITDGPFANYTNALGPAFEITDHCITRRISDWFSTGSAQSEVDKCYKLTTFEEVRQCIEARPHSGGHGGTGAQMQDPIASPGDPIFYLHHTWLDKVWWDWQALDLPARLSDISGPNRPNPGITAAFGVNGTCGPYVNCMDPPNVIPGDAGDITTLTHVLSTLDLLPNATIADVMDIGGSFLCYEYV